MLLSWSWSTTLAAAVPPSAEGATAAAAGTGKTLLEYIRSGGPIGAVIILLSVIAVALAIIHILQTRHSRLAPPTQVEDLTRRLREGDLQGVQRACGEGENPSSLARVLGPALGRCLRSPLGFLEIKAALDEAGSREADRLLKPIEYLGLIAAVGPMLGLLGTVFGMVGAFSSISNLEGAARSRELAGFMSLALVTTAMGLLLAIPCTVVYAAFRRRLDRAMEHVREVCERTTAVIDTQKPLPKAPAARPAGPAPRVSGAAAPSPTTPAASVTP